MVGREDKAQEIIESLKKVLGELGDEAHDDICNGIMELPSPVNELIGKLESLSIAKAEEDKDAILFEIYVILHLIKKIADVRTEADKIVSGSSKIHNLFYELFRNEHFSVMKLLTFTDKFTIIQK